jgi:hypothetical protein
MRPHLPLILAVAACSAPFGCRAGAPMAPADACAVW